MKLATEDANELIGRIAGAFDIPERFVSAERYGSGHINDTFAAVYHNASGSVRYIHQRINTRVFSDVPALMENIGRVTRHIGERQNKALTLVPARDGGDVLHRGGEWWRTYVFIEDAGTRDVLEEPAQAYEAARAFGEFGRMLADLAPPPLHESIPGFHDTPRRFGGFRRALASDPLGRAREAAAEIAFALANEPLAHALEVLRHAGVPQRIVHNDTKINNVMLDERSGRAVCVIDLDTVMPGYSLHDVGEMIRTATMSAAEDEQDLRKVTVRSEMFEAVVRGYLEGSGDLLLPAERAHVLTAGKVLTFENGIRFLTDFLLGDTYFRVHRPGHNLDRARTQFALLRSLEEREPELRKAIS